MLSRLILSLTAPGPRALKRIGLVREAIDVWKHGDRRRAEWAAHEARCFAVVERSLRGLPATRTVVVLGSGQCRDVPAGRLLDVFDHVVLVDAFHSPAARQRFAQHTKVRFETLDITGTAAWISGEADEPTDALAPFIDDPAVDLVISANCLSQLARCPEQWLAAHPARARALPANLPRRIVEDHLAALRRCRGRVCLLTDVTMSEVTAEGRVTETLDLMHGVPLPAPDEAWDWTVAPMGEVSWTRAYVHRVHGYADFNAPR